MSSASGVAGLLALTAVVAVPAYLSFELGGRSGREQGEVRMAQASRAHEAAVKAAIAEERQATVALRTQLTELKGQLQSCSPAALAKLRKELEKRRKRIKPSAPLLIDESLDFMALLERLCREALGEELAGATLELVKGRQAFILQLNLPAEPSDPEALAKLAESLSSLPPKVERAWVTHFALKVPEGRPFYLPIVELEAEAWQVLLETFREPHHLLPNSLPRRNSSYYKVAGLSLTHKLEVETTLELWGPKRVTALLRVGAYSHSERLPAGYYVLRTRAEGQVPFLGLLLLRSGHVTEPHLSVR